MTSAPLCIYIYICTYLDVSITIVNVREITIVRGIYNIHKIYLGRWYTHFFFLNKNLFLP